MGIGTQKILWSAPYRHFNHIRGAAAVAGLATAFGFIYAAGAAAGPAIFVNAGSVTTVAELEKAGLVAPAETLLPPASVPPGEA